MLPGLPLKIQPYIKYPEVVDKNGEPLVVYHGTESVSSVFDGCHSLNGDVGFQTQIPAKVANPAKNQEQQGFSSAKALLNVAKMQTGHMDTPSTLANFSKPLASQGAIPTKALASLAGLAAPEGESQTPPPDLSKAPLLLLLRLLLLRIQN